VRLLEIRRLTGPNLLVDGPAAVIDVAHETGEDPDAACQRLLDRVGVYISALGTDGPTWASEPSVTRRWSGPKVSGFTSVWPVAIDELYAACEVIEAAWEDVAAGEDERTVGPTRLAALIASTADERDLPLRAMLEAAQAHGVAGVWDDDELSVGLGAGSCTWARGDVPSPAVVDWNTIHDVPVALVTGTNGKSTTVRMLATILRAADRAPGNSSTDGIVVDGELVEAGDWSGPGGGRTVGRDTRVRTMVLECARGGLLRRGLPVDRAAVAVVTNIAEDHLGEYGIETVDDLALAKLVVAKAVRESGILVVNADDPLLVHHAPRDARTWWTSMDPDNPVLAVALREHAQVVTVINGVITHRTSQRDTPLVAVVDVPATMHGAAAHNVANALSAAAAAVALEIPSEAVTAGLRAFVADVANNPGRANRYDVDGVTVLVDFAHNVHGVAAMTQLLAALPAARRLVLFSQAGDRTDDALRDLSAAVAGCDADRYIVADVAGYLRGREPMEVPRRLAAGLVAAGVAQASINQVPDAIAGTAEALGWAVAGDALLLLVLEHRAEVAELLRAHGAVEA
jgi:cyanophycin synthetase